MGIKRFTIYDEDVKSSLQLIKKYGKVTDEIIDEVDNVYINLNEKTDKKGNHLGAWQGLERPTLSEEGMRSTVETHITKLNSIEERNKKVTTLFMLDFPRLANETNDVQRIQRAVDTLNSVGGGTLEFEPNFHYYLKTRNDYGCFIRTYKNINFNGNACTFYVDNESESGMSGMIKCLDIQNATFKNFTFDTTQRTLINDTSFYDTFYLRYEGDININVHFENINCLGKCYQTCLNFSVLSEVSPIQGRNVTIKNCEFFHTGYLATVSDVLYENVTWNMDLDALRPQYMEGFAQTPFKFTGRSSHNTGIVMKNCVVNVVGSRNPITIFECIRCNAIIDNLQVNGLNKTSYSTTSSYSTKAEYGISNNTTNLIIKNSKLDYAIYYGELANVIIENCTLYSVNALNSTYKVANKQSTLEKANGTAIARNCKFKNYARMLVDNGNAEITLYDCEFQHDREIATNGTVTIGQNSSLKMYNCKVTIDGNPNMFINANGFNELIVDGLEVVQGNGETETDHNFILISGACKKLSIKKYRNYFRRKGAPYIQLSSGASIVNRDIENEKIILTSNFKDYELKVVDGVLTVTEIL